ncbi:MAG: hypothetical protein IT380_00855 [Myxococcales bacterium]|nr:hypothetical protein [Myxococcales bacterium]
MVCRAPRSLVVAALTVFAFGCTPPTPEEVAARTSAEVKQLVREAYETGALTNSWRSVDDFFVNTGLAGAAASRPRLAGVSNLDPSLDEVSALVGRVLTEANVVSRSGGAIVFRVRGVDVCAGRNGAAPPPGCVEQVDRLQLDVLAQGQVDLTLRVGADHLEVLTLRIREGKSLALESDLAQVLAAWAALSGGAPTQVQGAGRVEVRLEKNGPQDFTFSQSVLSPLNLAVTPSDGVRRTLSVAASTLLSLRVEGPARRLTLAVNLGQLDAAGLGGDLLDDALVGPAQLSLAGVTGALVVQDGQAHRLERVSLGSGPSVLRYRGQDAFVVDWNSRHGRAADFTATAEAGSLSVLVTSPGLDLQVASNLELLEADLGRALAKEFRGARYDASLTAPSGQPTVRFLAPTASRGARLMLANGVLSLAVNDPAVAPRTFTGPVCLAPVSSVTPPANAFVEGLEAVACD